MYSFTSPVCVDVYVCVCNSWLKGCVPLPSMYELMSVCAIARSTLTGYRLAYSKKSPGNRFCLITLLVLIDFCLCVHYCLCVQLQGRQLLWEH